MARIRWGWLLRGCKKMQFFCKKMQNYLHISNIFRIFAPDLEIVPSITLKKGKDMKKRCVFRIEVEGSLWRVTEEKHPHVSSMYVYRIMHHRRCQMRIPDWNAQEAIETACKLAFGVNVVIAWR